MTVTLRPLRSDDPADIAGAHRVIAAARAHDVPDFPPYPLDEFVGRLRYPWPGSPEQAHVAVVNDAAGSEEIAGTLIMSLPHLDNTHLAGTELTVSPSRRRQGIGRLLFERARELAEQHGRSTLTGEHVVGIPGGEPREIAPTRFAAAMGIDRTLPEARRRLDLDRVPDLAAMESRVRQEAAGYSVVAWVGSVPPEYEDDVARLDGRLLLDAPTGDMKIEPQAVDAARVRASDEVARLRGRRVYGAGARHDASGRIVAFSTIGLDAGVSTHAWQAITIVEPDHRGHRLGLLVKLANLAQTRAHEPALAHVNTWNAQENTHMIAINEQLGFRPIDHWVTWQLDLRPNDD